MQIELPGRRAWPGGHCTPGVGSGIPGVELPGRPGVDVPGMLGVGLPGTVGVVGPGVPGVVGMPGPLVPPPGAGIWAQAVPARIRLVAIAASGVFQRMRSILVMTIPGARLVPRLRVGGFGDPVARMSAGPERGGKRVLGGCYRRWNNGSLTPLTLPSPPEGRGWRS